MAETIASYLEMLEDDLRGRLPVQEVALILDESASHLYELAQELGSEEQAVGKFGNPRRYARRILLEAAAIPNPWRACIFPFTFFVVYFLLLVFNPGHLIEQLTGPVSLDGIVLLASICNVVLILSFIRVRQILVRPLLAFGVLQFVVWGGVLTNLGTPVSVPGGEGRIVQRQPQGLANYYDALNREIADQTRNRHLLEKGIAFFSNNPDPTKVPSELTVYDGGTLNPSTIVSVLTFKDSERKGISVLKPLFLSNEHYSGQLDPGFPSTVAAWRREGASALARVNEEIRLDKAYLAAAPGAVNASLWSAFWGHSATAFQFALRCTVSLAYPNVAGWLIGILYWRFRLPRRRFA